MISHRHRCIFVHIPRTGGTSIENAIWPDTRTEADLWMGFVAPMHNKHQTGGLQHLLARQIREEAGQDTFDAYFRFSFVRNPWDKALSQFFFMRGRPDLRAFAGLRADAPLAEYLEHIAAVEHVQWMPQFEFLDGPDGDCLVEFVGRFESLEADMRHVFARLGVDGIRLPHANASERGRDYRPYYDAAARAAVARIYAQDIERFEYTF